MEILGFTINRKAKSPNYRWNIYELEQGLLWDLLTTGTSQTIEEAWKTSLDAGHYLCMNMQKANAIEIRAIHENNRLVDKGKFEFKLEPTVIFTQL